MPFDEKRVEELVAAALAQPSPEAVAAYLKDACAGDEPLRLHVAGLLSEHFSKASEAGAPGGAATPPSPSRLRWAFGDLLRPDQGDGPGSRIGSYKLLQRLGEGGMGTVWMAEQSEPVRRMVALKVIKPGMDSANVLARFEAEGQALALMEHPNIAKVFEAGITDAGRPYFVMELVKGIPITKYCDEQRLSIRERLELFIPVCQAIQHAHQKGIIHRDIKPSNVMVTQFDGKPVPKVIDFGVAKAMGQQLTEQTLFTEFGAVIGTIEYMSPEQAELNQLDIDTRSDIYSLGVLLYQLLTGTTPLSRESIGHKAVDELLRCIREQEPPRPSSRLSESKEALAAISAQRKLDPAQLTRVVRGDLDWIVMKALEKDRNHRYETANGLAMDLQRHLHDEPVLARPPTTSYRLRKFARKHRAPVAAAAAFMVLLVAGMAISTGLAIWANKERARAAKAEKEANTQVEETKAVIGFLRDKVLAAARPEGQNGGLGREVTLRRAIESAESDIAIMFTNRPYAEAEIRDAIGMTFKYLGDYTNAIHELQQALACAQTGRGSRHQDMVMNNLASAYMAAGRWHEAVPLQEEAVRIAKAKRGPDHSLTLIAMDNLAGGYNRVGRTKEALPLLEETLRLCKAKWGAEHPDTATVLHNLAMMHQEAGRLTTALPLLEEALRIFRAKVGEAHPDTLICMNNLARTYNVVGATSNALPLFQQVLNVQNTNLGPDHPTTRATKDNLAFSYRGAGKFAEAEALYREILAYRRTHDGPNSASVAGTLGSVGDCYLKQKKFTEAEPALREALGICERQSPDSWETFKVRSRLGAAFAGQGKYSEAEPLMIQGYEGLQRDDRRIGEGPRASLKDAAEGLVQLYQAWGRPAQGAEWQKKFLDDDLRYFNKAVASQHLKVPIDGPALAGALAELGAVLLQVQKVPEAELALRECLAIREKIVPDEWLTFNAKSMFGSTLLAQKRYDEAEPLLLDGYLGMARRENIIPVAAKVRLKEARERLFQLYEAWGKPEQAAKWRQNFGTPEASRP